VNAVVERISIEAPHEVRRPVMLQGWFDLAAFHWRYEPSEVQALLPDGFAVDTYDGSAWVSVIPFHMRRIRVPGLPALGPLSTFPETNVRTYITDPRGRRGVWFFSLDVTRVLPALVARVGYGLPYDWASMAITTEGDGEIRRYTSRRHWPHAAASSNLAIRIGPRLGARDLCDLDHFLSARWALGTKFGRRLLWANVAHPPWPLHAAELLECNESLVPAAGLRAPRGVPIARWSPGVEVRVGLPRPIPRSVSS
jgi:uncharacterized protein